MASKRRVNVQGNSGGSVSAGQLKPRRRAGRPILPVQNPSGGDLTPEQVRLVRRRMHNRESARRSRSKRQATFEEQSDKVDNPDCRSWLGLTMLMTCRDLCSQAWWEASMG